MSKINPDYPKIRKWIDQPKNVVITTHRNPDGDAIGSCLGMQLFLEAFGHKVTVLMPSEYPLNFSWMPKIADCLIYDLQPDECKAALEQTEWFIALDFNGLDRIDKMGEIWNQMKTDDIPSLLIDHHIDPEPFVQEIFSHTSASSTCELVYDFIMGLQEQKKMNSDIADCLFTGIITDTGRFRHATSSKVYRTASELKSFGARDVLINDYIFNSFTEKQLKLLGYCLYERMEVLEDYQTAIISLSREDYKTFDIQRGDTEGIVNYMLSMPHIRLAAFITEQPTIVKYSLRSKGDISVQEMASKYFNGGGHKNASGGAVHTSLRKAIDNFKKVLPQYVHSSINTNSINT
jgi:phosphoesterase RecJ-like protein